MVLRRQTYLTTSEMCTLNYTINVRKKRAMFISRACKLFQEFAEFDRKVLMYLSDVYNGHYTGSQAWSLFCPEAIALEKSYNTNMRVLNDVPRDTHT